MVLGLEVGVWGWGLGFGVLGMVGQVKFSVIKNIAYFNNMYPKYINELSIFDKSRIFSYEFLSHSYLFLFSIDRASKIRDTCDTKFSQILSI